MWKSWLATWLLWPMLVASHVGISRGLTQDTPIRFMPSNTFGSESPEDDEEASERWIETDRNSFTLAPTAVEPGRLIAETSYSLQVLEQSDFKHSFPELLLRYGLLERVELRLGWNYETGPESEVVEGDIADFFSADVEQQMLYGTKLQMTRQRGWKPSSIVILQGITPTIASASTTRLRTGVAWGWRLPNYWVVNAAMRYGTEVEAEDRFNIWAPSVVVRIPFGERRRWFTHLEYFSLNSSGKEDNFAAQVVDTGLHWIPTPNSEVGFLIGTGLNRDSPEMLVNVGIAFRF